MLPFSLFGPRPSPQRPDLAIWGSGRGDNTVRSSRYEVRQTGTEVGEKRRGGGEEDANELHLC
jgi:hypothetical protein